MKIIEQYKVMSNEMFNKHIPTIKGLVIIIIAAVILVGGAMRLKNVREGDWLFAVHPGPVQEQRGVKQFSSEQDFKEYLTANQTSASYGFGFGRARVAGMPQDVAIQAPTAEKEMGGMGEGGAPAQTPERVSQTTVQVLAIDEPDIVKTDGKRIYFSSQGAGYVYGAPRPLTERKIVPPQREGKTDIIKAFPPANLAVEGEIKKGGELLIHKNMLVISTGRKIYGFDVSEPEQPEQKWAVELENNNYLVTSRFYKDKIYLVTRSRIDTYHPCPIRPLSIKGSPVNIKCADIYHPKVHIPVDVTYTALILDPISGAKENVVSFVGKQDSSVVYMSENGLYITYSYYADFVKFMFDFFQEECQDLVPVSVLNRLDKLIQYDISSAAKMTELQIIMQRFQNSLGDDERLKIENELKNRMSDYFKTHKREFEQTGIVKIGLKGFQISATGNVPGRPLNQFSLDEHKGYLRLATTVGQRGFGGFGGFGGVEASANDVYVLNRNLEAVGSVLDMGLGERIYSVRFLGDKGYVITFKRIDPFFVLDLSHPQSPQIKGKLKIPGYSSYLHPISDNKILGIGKEGSQVKISLFDVADPQNPIEKDKYLLDEYWSDILNTHHAFLLDKKHRVFFLPGNKGGYVFSYQAGKLELKKAIAQIQAKRAVYLDDYLYIISQDEITVLNELDWQKVNQLEL